MNIFKYNTKNFDKKINKIFDKQDPKKLKKYLIKCGLVIEKK